MTPWKQRPRWQRWLGEGLLLLALLLLLRAWQQRDLTLDTPAPPLAGISHSGSPLTLAAFAGQPVVIHFFAPWCPVCRAMHDNITRLSPRLTILQVAVQTPAEELEQWLNEHPDDDRSRILSDPTGDWLAAYGAKALPATFFISANGHIHSAELGYTSTLGIYLRTKLTP